MMLDRPGTLGFHFVIDFVAGPEVALGRLWEVLPGFLIDLHINLIYTDTPGITAPTSFAIENLGLVCGIPWPCP